MSDLISRETAIQTVHETMYQFIDGNGTMTNSDFFLLKVNKAICNGLKEIPSVENEEESEDQSVEWYCTDCPYFQFTGEPSNDWYGARCNKDNHEASPSMYAIQSLNNNCPLNRG